MKFIIRNINIWLKNGLRRDIKFLDNKVNVITGGSGTGKSALFQILDYCFFASSHQISEDKINENVAWYGLNFTIREKDFLLARRSPNGNAVSPEYYFSSLPDPIPENLSANISEVDLRTIIETEFDIGEKVVFPFGGKSVKAGSKISPRYFFMFCTISEDIITSTDVFFDKQSQERYREALPRIFDLALGIDNVENIIFREKKLKLENEISSLKRKQDRALQKYDAYQKEAAEIVKKAIAFGLADEEQASNPIDTIRAIVEKNTKTDHDWKGRYAEISAKILAIDRKLRGLQRLTQEYKRYKQILSAAEDSVAPIQILRDKSDEVVKTDHFLEIIQDLNIDLKRIKSTIAHRNPVDAQISQIQNKYRTEKETLSQELAALPEIPAELKSEKEKWIFIGELKGRLSMFIADDNSAPISYADEISKIERELSYIPVEDVSERRDLAMRMIEREALKYLKIAGDALDNYASYEPIFSYKEKRLRLRKPGKLSFENVGSSSNHMFLHLAQFLALQELSLAQGSPFVPSFLLIDQPSRPYFGDNKKETKNLTSSDNYKIAKAFEMLDKFISNAQEVYETDFQIIVLEHAPPETWDGLKNFHLVETFIDGNALVPSFMLSSEK